MKKPKHSIALLFIVIFVLFAAISYLFNLDDGQEIVSNFLSFSFNLFLILPFAFLLIGLFEVWVKRETIEKHFGQTSKVKGFIWAILLGGTTVGGVYVAFPVAHSLLQKGARLRTVYTYIGASAICRIPMTIFEASFVGLKFTLIRLFVSLPLVILSAIAMELLFKKHIPIQK